MSKMSEDTLRRVTDEISDRVYREHANDESREDVADIIRAVDTLCHVLNTMASDDERLAQAFVLALGMNHPTQQQSFWRVMRAVIARYANAPHDLRNEASVVWCRRVADEVKAYLPFV